MAPLTAAQKKRLKAHSKSQTPTHMKAMASLMKAGKSFSEAHVEVSKKSQKQKQSQSQKVIINLAPSKRGTTKRRAIPRPLSYQQHSARVLAQFAQPVGMGASFNPAPTIYQPARPQPFRPEVSQPQLNRPTLAEELELARPIKAPSGMPTPREEQRSMKIEEIRSRLAERQKGGAKRNANLDDTPAEAAELPSPLIPVPPMRRGGSATSAGYSTSATVPLPRFDEEDEGFLSDTTQIGMGGPSPSLRRY